MEQTLPKGPTALAQLGVAEQILRTAVERGEIARRGCTELDPPTRAGYSAWAETTRAIREGLVGNGWRALQGGSCPTVSPDGKVAIIVQAGDEATGTQQLTPHSKNPKGPAVELAVANNNQLLLWDDELPPKDPPPAETWVLLVSHDPDEVRFELSLPAGVDSDGRIVAWQQRILFAPIKTEPISVVLQVEDTGEIEIDVRKKKA